MHQTFQFDDNLAHSGERCIVAYEGNKLDWRHTVEIIYISGEKTDSIPSIWTTTG